MRLSRRNPGEGGRRADQPGGPADQPARLPQRWAIILGLASTATITLSIGVNIATGATVGLGIIGLLHAIID
ncbi:hypothetical protein ACRYCC_02890 [Actinomadura scrupuli]|uniref:hypothetical protein n=1 Tax=Actinomadura scrupuli TaxID=559629 RepID=UPI003D967A6B